MDFLGLIKDKGLYTFLGILAGAVVGLINPGFVTTILIGGGIVGVGGVLYKVLIQYNK
jgi:hypothetical protein